MAREADRVLAPLDALVAPGRSTVAATLGRRVPQRHPRHRAAT